MSLPRTQLQPPGQSVQREGRVFVKEILFDDHRLGMGQIAAGEGGLGNPVLPVIPHRMDQKLGQEQLHLILVADVSVGQFVEKLSHQ